MKFFCCINQPCIDTRAKLFSFLFSLVPSDEEESCSVLFPNHLQLHSAKPNQRKSGCAYTGPTHGVANGPTVRPHGRIKFERPDFLADFVNKGPKGGRTCILFNDKQIPQILSFFMTINAEKLSSGLWSPNLGAVFFFSMAESEFIIRTVRKRLETQNLFTKLV